MFLRNFALMNKIILLSAVLFMLCSCGRKSEDRETFRVEVMNKITPVKDQGSSSLCWVYAMLATIESECLMKGDSVNLSAAYVARNMMRRQAERCYLTQGRSGFTTRGVAPRLIAMIHDTGLMPYDSYRSDCNFSVLCRKLNSLCRNAVGRRTGLDALMKSTDNMLDDVINPVPLHVWMLGAEYTPQEFARSVCRTDEYQALTSFTHKPFYEDVVLDVPDNHYGDKFYNVPIDTLMSRIESALRRGHSVCWEGDISEPGFSFESGVARLGDNRRMASQKERQRAFETFSTTDDHCMELIGIARDSKGDRYFICKNSWGTGNPYGGLMFMSVAYARLKTVAAVVPVDTADLRRMQ